MRAPSDVQISDRGRRLSDAVEAARAAGGVGRFIAARLSDGTTDGQIYDTRDDAVRHQLHETQCAYLVVPPGVMPPREASAWLDLHERMYDAGMRLSDPDQVTGAALAEEARRDPQLAAGLGMGRAARRGAGRHRPNGLVRARDRR